MVFATTNEKETFFIDYTDSPHQNFTCVTEKHKYLNTTPTIRP